MGNNKKKVDIGLILANMLLLVMVIILATLFIAIPFVISFAVIYLAQVIPFIDFHFYEDFWGNFWFFTGFTLLSLFMVAIIETAIFIDRKDKKFRSLDDIGPSSLKEWIIFLTVFSVYMNAFNLYSERLDTNFIGATIIGLVFVFLLYVFGKIIDLFADEEDTADVMEEK
ncbi:MULTISPECIES: hypothetical protein [Virgibacillus]|uniref:DUF2975 domain-containing protein n=1 Tax=Virgibacillus dokdonensis TaxID=302167 RepID=A0ABU7VGV4_9BACI|nr:hypothetical protein [Virgibacillus sp.]NWO12604.1 hypothetical protein [Virgibacillus sp.]